MVNWLEDDNTWQLDSRAAVWLEDHSLCELCNRKCKADNVISCEGFIRLK
jgi:uncharacterized Fe-S radical SAM superfamily protein PflX